MNINLFNKHTCFEVFKHTCFESMFMRTTKEICSVTKLTAIKIIDKNTNNHHIIYNTENNQNVKTRKLKQN